MAILQERYFRIYKTNVALTFMAVIFFFYVKMETLV